ncbi:RloB family protein [Weeksellaceae bacterium TAE3-ERU29]|nr:RloB family protein [Weeksellaceae bacterium TAE3-ERU29]
MRNKRQLKERIVLICDGETEKWYFTAMNRHSAYSHIDIFPHLVEKASLEKQKQQVENYAKDYDIVFWVVDLDAIIHDNKIQEFNTYYNALKSESNIKIVVVNPCLEYWLLLHFRYTNMPFSNCNDVGQHLKKELPKYEKKQNFYLGSKNIFELLFSNLDTAIDNSKKTGNYNPFNFKNTCCEFHKIFKHLKSDK